MPKEPVVEILGQLNALNSNNQDQSTDVYPSIWNSLSKSLKSTAILQSFKNKLKREARTLENIQFEKAASVVIAKDPNYIYF